MWRKVILSAAALAATGVAATLLPAAAQAKPATPASSCFLPTEWTGWTAAPGGDALYLRVGLRDIYRLDLTPGSRARKGAGDFLVTHSTGSHWICSALDLQGLSISDDLGFKRPLIASNLRKLTPAEVAAIPRRDLP
jgi:hypothetical protein